MENIDVQKLSVAIEYVNRLANGNNPLNNAPLADDEVLDNPNIIRCMFFVRDVLKMVYNNGGVITEKTKKKKTKSVPFPEELLSQFEYRQDQSINNFINQLYEPLADKDIRKISGTTIAQRLEGNGYIKTEYNEEMEKEIRVPTEKGMAIGMRVERREGRPPYPSVFYTIIYNQQAQEFLVANFISLLSGEVIE